MRDAPLDQLLHALEERPNDPELLRKVGELFQKRGDDKAAAPYFVRIAELYERDGFQLKAVALYNQVLKLDEGRIEILSRLASLHASLDLEEEACGYLLKARDAFLKAGRRQDAIEMERKLAERNVVMGRKPIARA
jgi:tetratricopeptide (TPR) repeat protein